MEANDKVDKKKLSVVEKGMERGKGRKGEGRKREGEEAVEG